MAEVEFRAPMTVLAPTLPGSPVRNDDTRFVPLGGSTGQVLTKSGSGDYAMAWAAASGGLGGVVDCSAMTTAAAINAASLAAPDGSVIWLGRHPSSAPLVLEDTIIMRPRQKILGAGGRMQLTCVQAGPSFAAGKPVIAAAGYLNNGTTADNPVCVMGVHIDVNTKAGSHGLVVYNFWSHFEDIQVANCNGAAAHGMHVTDRGVNGTSVSVNSHSENTFKRCRFDAFTGKASMFWAECTNGLNNSNQDGHLQDCFFASDATASGFGVRITRAAGWTIDNNHFYGIGYDAISLDACYATKVTRNYIEDFGGDNGGNNGAAPTYGYYNGIAMGSVLDTRASTIEGNTISCIQANAPTGNRWTGITARPGSGQILANVVIVGNTIVWAQSTAPTTNRTWAVRLGEGGDTGRELYVEWAGNQIQSALAWQGTRYVEATTVTLTEPGAGGGGVPTTRLVSAGTGLTGGGDLSADRTLAVAYGTAAGTAAQGNDSRITGAVQGARALTAGTGLTGGGDLTADRSFAVAYGTSGTTACVGNDARLSDSRTPSAHATSHRAGGSDVLVPAPRTVTFSATPTVAAASGIELDRVNITATGNITSLALSGGFDGQKVEVAVVASGGTRTVTIASGVDTSTGVTRGPYSIASALLGIFLFRYSTLNNEWAIVAATVTAS
jgi:hypothetical protein